MKVQIPIARLNGIYIMECLGEPKSIKDIDLNLLIWEIVGSNVSIVIFYN